MRISDWSSDVCSSDLARLVEAEERLENIFVALRRNAGAVVVDGHLDQALAPPGPDRDVLAVALGVGQQVGEAAAHGFAAQRQHEVLLDVQVDRAARSEEHTSELQSLMRISYAVFC